MLVTALWDPGLYGRFEAERGRPVRDLLSEVGGKVYQKIVDLGCGAGLSTEALSARFPGAVLTGIDTSPEMLEAARARLPKATFLQAQAETWSDPSTDLVFANALMHWVRGHLFVMRRLASELPPGGRLAVQMPDNEAEPSHALMREIAARPRFRKQLADVGATRESIGAPEDYDEALSSYCETVVIWRTVYVHRLSGPDDIVAVVQGAGLRPFLAPLDEAEKQEFLAAYRAEIAKAYPTRAWGGVLFRFPRLFVVGVRPENASAHG